MNTTIITNIAALQPTIGTEPKYIVTASLGSKESEAHINNNGVSTPREVRTYHA